MQASIGQVTGVGVLLFVVVVALLVSYFFNGLAVASVGIAFGLVFFLSIPGVIVSWVWGRASSGAVLLDCGPHPTRVLFIMNAVFMALSGCGVLGSVPDMAGGVGSLLLFSFACYWGLMASGRLQVCENGLWQYWSLLKWGKIKSYHWKGQSDATLMVQTTNRFAFLGRGALPVRKEFQQAVDELVQRKLNQQQE